MESEEKDIYMSSAIMLICFVGIVGNTITLLVLKKNKNFMAINNSRLHIGHLAFLNLVFSIANAVSGFGFIDKKIIIETFLCTFIARATTIQIPLTYLTYAIIAIHRLESLKASGGPQQERLGFIYRWHSIAAIWISSVIISCFININKVIGPIVYHPSLGSCGGTGPIMTGIMASASILGTTVVLISYVKIFRLVKLNNLQIRNRIESTDATERVLGKRMAKITKMLFIIFVSQVVSNIPFTVVSILKKRFIINSIWQSVTFLIIFTNHANNFFIYGLLDKEFRAQVKNLSSRNKVKVIYVGRGKNVAPL